MNMTNQQYYWMRRQQTLRAYAQLMAHGAGGEADMSTKVASETEIREAFKEAKDGDTIKLTAPIALTEIDPETGAALLLDKSITLDLNGQILKSEYDGVTSATPNKDMVIGIKRGATVTITGNGAVDNGNLSCVYAAIKLSITGENDPTVPANVVIENGTFKARYYGITGHGNRGNCNATINGGSFEGYDIADESLAIYWPNSGNLTINAGTFKGSDCIAVKSGNVVINGGTFYSYGPKKTYAHNPSGWCNTGDCFAVEACDYPGQIPTVVINGGTFYSENAEPVASYAQAGYSDRRPTLFVKGGKFNKALATDLIAEGYKQVLSGDWYVVVPE